MGAVRAGERRLLRRAARHTQHRRREGCGRAHQVLARLAPLRPEVHGRLRSGAQGSGARVVAMRHAHAKRWREAAAGCPGLHFRGSHEDRPAFEQGSSFSHARWAHQRRRQRLKLCGGGGSAQRHREAPLSGSALWRSQGVHSALCGAVRRDGRRKRAVDRSHAARFASAHSAARVRPRRVAPSAQAAAAMRAVARRQPAVAPLAAQLRVALSIEAGPSGRAAAVAAAPRWVQQQQQQQRTFGAASAAAEDHCWKARSRSRGTARRRHRT